LELIAIDGSQGEGGGQILRTALALSAVTGRGFKIERIRARRLRPGLRPQHLAAVRSVALCCNAEVHGAFEGSPDLRFIPQAPSAGSYEFDIGTAGAATLVLQTVLPVLATADAPSTVTVLGGTHVPRSPGFHFLSRHWVPAVAGLGLSVQPKLVCAGFAPRGEGRLECEVRPWLRPSTLDLSVRGPLRAVRGISGSGRLRGDVAKRAAEAAKALLWEARRIESAWDVVEVESSSPGSFLQAEAIFEWGRAAFAQIGERGLRPEVMGERAVRRLLRFLGDEEAVVDPLLADQMALPLAIAQGGGQLLTSEVTAHLETVSWVLGIFGIPSETWGRLGGPGGLRVGRWP
jgi:RNA 3'-terminal phosphate cyclase (ATP)